MEAEMVCVCDCENPNMYCFYEAHNSISFLFFVFSVQSICGWTTKTPKMVDDVDDQLWYVCVCIKSAQRQSQPESLN